MKKEKNMVKKDSKIMKLIIYPAGLIASLMGYIRRRKWRMFLIVAILAVGGWFLTSGSSQKKSELWITSPITRGNLRQVVTATGEIRPLNTIKVGSQVSGIIEEIYVDFNDKVKAGQILLKIDPSVLQASVDEAKAALDSATATRNFDQREFNRAKTLYGEGFIARSEMEQAETRFKTSEESVRRAKSQYERAMTNLNYATITSPVDGTVISRKVDRGQTVAASFQAPDLFEIAEDLSKMRIETSVSEADIGSIREDQTVTFTVDAYPNQTFNGMVRQIRLSPTTAQSVVIYTVIIDVDNSDMRLMPGMTAFVTILVAEKNNVWKATNASFLIRTLKPLSDDKCIQDGTCTPRNTLLIERSNNDKKAGNNAPILVKYSRGIVTATETEIIPEPDDALEEGDRMITGKIGASTGNASGGGQRGGIGGMGGGGMGGGMGGGGRR
ncbi:MAG: efflux RND transporter periplasmic adaptor subunit [Alphaproteobacteria bacterium]|nr:efflux RND transporter periplasmic adaptor subunit [Alphaproteobacteria bacterium]